MTYHAVIHLVSRALAVSAALCLALGTLACAVEERAEVAPMESSVDAAPPPAAEAALEEAGVEVPQPATGETDLATESDEEREPLAAEAAADREASD